MADLALQTTGTFKSEMLERMLNANDMSNSYTILWLRGVFEEALEGNTQVSFARVVGRMFAAAWYPVNYFKLNLGAQDKVASGIKHLRENEGLGVDASADEIIAATENATNKSFQQLVKRLCVYAPHLLIRPFYDAEIQRWDAATGGMLMSAELKRVILEANAEDANGALYVINPAYDALTIDESWITYLQQNRAVVQGWLDMRFAQYLQERNPNVLAISQKLRAASAHNMLVAESYWWHLLEFVPLTEIYSKVAFTDAAFDTYGDLKVGHFIPWSFVGHDEPWNLVPMFEGLNGEKGEKLPDFKKYFDAFASQQFEALMMLKYLGKYRTLVEAYKVVDPDVFEYENNKKCAKRFKKNLKKTIKPLWQLAYKQGFEVWKAPKSK